MASVLITGATNGIGKETARVLAARGYDVVVGCRDRELAFKVKREFGDLGTRIEVGPALDLTSLDSIRSFVAQFGDRPLSVLINNAGCNYKFEEYSKEGVPLTMQVNYVGTYLLTRLLLPNLRKSRTRPQVVNVASIFHRMGRISAARRFLSVWDDGDYPNSKLALVMFTHELQRRFGLELDCCCVDPGGVKTKIFETTVFGHPPLSWYIKAFYSSPEDAALTLVEAVAWEGKKGKSLFFARGSFAWPLITRYYGNSPSFFGACFNALYCVVALLQTTVDYPMRMTFGQQQTRPVPPVGCSWNEEACEALWRETESLVQLQGAPKCTES